MEETTPEATNETGGNEPEVDQQETDAKSEELGGGGKRALDSERKARRAAEKRAQDAEAKVKLAEDAEKTEIERLKGQVDEWKSRAEKAEADSLRHAIAAAKGLTLAQARRLVGSTKEELEDDADSMRAELGLKDEPEGSKTEPEGEKKDEEGAFGLPRERMEKTGAANAEDEQPDAAKLADSILSSHF